MARSPSIATDAPKRELAANGFSRFDWTSQSPRGVLFNVIAEPVPDVFPTMAYEPLMSTWLEAEPALVSEKTTSHGSDPPPAIDVPMMISGASVARNDEVGLVFMGGKLQDRGSIFSSGGGGVATHGMPVKKSKSSN